MGFRSQLFSCTAHNGVVVPASGWHHHSPVHRWREEPAEAEPSHLGPRTTARRRLRHADNQKTILAKVPPDPGGVQGAPKQTKRSAKVTTARPAPVSTRNQAPRHTGTPARDRNNTPAGGHAMERLQGNPLLLPAIPIVLTIIFLLGAAASIYRLQAPSNLPPAHQDHRPLDPRPRRHPDPQRHQPAGPHRKKPQDAMEGHPELPPAPGGGRPPAGLVRISPGYTPLRRRQHHHAS